MKYSKSIRDPYIGDVCDCVVYVILFASYLYGSPTMWPQRIAPQDRSNFQAFRNCRI